MVRPSFAPREGGVKIVFDVRSADADRVIADVGAHAFEVRRYYADDAQLPGRAAPGWVRFGAERRMDEFSAAEQERIVTAFETARRATGTACTVVGTDVWTAGDDGRAGDREPRCPVPRAASGVAAAVRPR